MEKKNNDTLVSSKENDFETIKEMVSIPKSLYNELKFLGIIDYTGIRTHNVGESNYSKHTIQPWSIWLDYPDLTSWDHDIIKRVLRTKLVNGFSYNYLRIEDYNKIIHNCEERIRQLQDYETC